MTIPRYMALVSYWNEWPPLHRIAAAWSGYKPPKKAEATLEEFMAAAQQISGG